MKMTRLSINNYGHCLIKVNSQKTTLITNSKKTPMEKMRTRMKKKNIDQDFREEKNKKIELKWDVGKGLINLLECGCPPNSGDMKFKNFCI